MSAPRPLRRRRVRFQYPSSMQRLACALAVEHDRRQIAALLGLPLSTVYRWARLASVRAPVDRYELVRAVDDCRAHGFDVAQAVERLTGSLPSTAASDDRAAAERPDGAADTADFFDRRRRADELDARMQSAVRLIEREYFSSLSCDTMASAAGVSKFHFIKLFKGCFGISPYRALLAVRVHHAKILLRTTLQPVPDVAKAVGFETESAMRRAFFSIERRTMSEFCIAGADPRPHRPRTVEDVTV
jgi:AraC-like DNA-binding protein